MVSVPFLAKDRRNFERRPQQLFLQVGPIVFQGPHDGAVQTSTAHARRDPAGPGLERRLSACWDQQDAKTRRKLSAIEEPVRGSNSRLTSQRRPAAGLSLWLKPPLKRAVNAAGLTPRLPPGCSLREQAGPNGPGASPAGLPPIAALETGSKRLTPAPLRAP